MFMILVSKINYVVSQNPFINLKTVITTSGGHHLGFFSKMAAGKINRILSKMSYLGYYSEYSYDFGV